MASNDSSELIIPRNFPNIFYQVSVIGKEMFTIINFRRAPYIIGIRQTRKILFYFRQFIIFRQPPIVAVTLIGTWFVL